MSEWLANAAVGGLIRMVEGAISAAPTLLVGLLIAAVLRYYLGSSGTRKLFGGDSIRSLPQSWAIGMLLPVCSIGVLPILFEMRRCRIKPGAMSAFALSAPLFNPLSLLYGLTLSRPYVILFFAFGSLLVVTLVGLYWDRRVAAMGEESGQAPPDRHIIGTARLLAVFVYITRELAGRAGGWALVGLTGLILLAAVLPWGTLQGEVNRDDWMAPAKMAAVALPAYATPMLAMSQLGMMFQHANSPGAAFVLLVLGTGVNIATIGWFGKSFGARSVATWLASVLLIVLGIAYAINRPLVPPGVDPSEHTHAFDIYTNPIHNLDTISRQFITNKIEQDVDLGERFGLLATAILLSVGLGFRALGIDETKLENWGRSPETEQPQLASYDRIVGPQVVGVTMLVGLIVVSVVMCYAFYPSTEESLAEIKIARAETLSAATSGNVDHAMFWIPIWDEWSRRLEVGTYIRRFELRPYQRMQGYLVRKKLEELEHELAHEPLDRTATRAIVVDLMNANSRWVRSYRDAEMLPDESRLQQSFNTQADLSHEHRHRHEEGQDHDHEHGDFRGEHSHDHDHAHRHADAPNGGRIIPIAHTSHRPGVVEYHAEIMPVAAGNLTFRLLTESPDGSWQGYPIDAATIDATVQAGDEPSVPVTFRPNPDQESSAFTASLPSSVAAVELFRVTVPEITLGQQVLEFEFVAGSQKTP